MAESQLKTVEGTGTQATTQSPQGATGQSGGSALSQAKNVQPGTATSVLVATDGGIQLQSTPLTTVSLGTASSTSSTSSAPVARGQHFNPVLLGVSVLLCLIAAVMFWTTMRSAKNTTNYS